MGIRKVQRLISPVSTSDGAGVRLQRSLGQSPFHRHDPFLLLDEFGSDEAADYIRGFPAHPHRGFETVTYMLEGHMLHEDHLGNRGDLRSGGVQWMSAGRGIIHSEMPQQTEGKMHGFQLWVNLPASDKMKPAAYRDIPAEEIPVFDGNGLRVKVVAGEYGDDDSRVTGPVSGPATQPQYFDVTAVSGTVFSQDIDPAMNVLIYVYEGAVTIGSESVEHGAALLGEGDRLEVIAGPDGASFLVLAGKPLNEPVVQYGPFVMNTREEIEQALADYKAGRLTD